MFLHADNEDSDQSGLMLVLSCADSNFTEKIFDVTDERLFFVIVYEQACVINREYHVYVF